MAFAADRSPETSPWPSRGPLYAGFRLFIIALVFVAIAPLFWHRTQIHEPAAGPAYENSDLYQDIYPAYKYAFERVRAWQWPAWNAKILCGTPCLANPNVGVFQPLNLAFAFRETGQAMADHGFRCLVLMGVGMVLLGRAMGLGYLAAIGGGVVYAFCGASAAAILRPSMASVLAWTPFLFWGIRESARRGCTFSSAWLPGLMGALVLLAGSIPLAVVTLLVAAAYGALFVASPLGERKTDLRARIEWLVLVLAIMLGLSAIQWVPTLAWLPTLDRPWDALLAWPLPCQAPSSVEDLARQLLAPKEGMLPRVAYFGAVALTFVSAALLAPRTMRREVGFLVLACALLFVFSVGAPSEWPSGDWNVRFPWLVCLYPGMLCLAMLFAIGLDRLLLTPQYSEVPRRAWPLFVILLTTWLLLFCISPAEPRGRLLAALPPILLALTVRRRRVLAACGVALLALLYVDMASSSLNRYQHPFLDAPGCYLRHGGAIAKAEEQAMDARVHVAGQEYDYGLAANLGMVLPTLYSAGGRAPLTKEQAVWWRRLRGSVPGTGTQVGNDAEMPRLLDAMAVRVVLTGAGTPLYGAGWTKPGPRLRELPVTPSAPLASPSGPDAPAVQSDARALANDSAWPRLQWVPAWRAVDGVAAACDILGAEGFDPTRECLVDRDGPGLAQLSATIPDTPATGGRAECLLAEAVPERITIKVSATAPGITVLADTWDRGWKATLDGAACPILRVNGIFRGIAAPAGDHEIVLEYRPVSARAGMGVTGVTAGLIVLAGLARLRRRAS